MILLAGLSGGEALAIGIHVEILGANLNLEVLPNLIAL